MNGDKYLANLSKNKLFRVMAWIGLIVILGLIIATLVTGVMGSKYFLGFLVLTILAPVFMYIFLFFGRVLYNLTQSNEEEVEKPDNKDFER